MTASHQLRYSPTPATVTHENVGPRHKFSVGARVVVTNPVVGARTSTLRGQSAQVLICDPVWRPSPAYVIDVDGQRIFVWEHELSRV